MTTRNWNAALKEFQLESENIATKEDSLSNTSLLQELLREKVMVQLSTDISPLLNSGRNNQILISAEIDKALDAVVSNAEQDGVDVDSELIEYLVELSGSLHAIESAWQRLLSLTSI